MKKILFLFIILNLLIISACKYDKQTTLETTFNTTITTTITTNRLANLDLNFKDVDHSGVYYQIFVRSFADSDGNGIGDFNGISENIGYLKDLGIKGIWLMPMLESDSYHGYDVTNYLKVEPDYGTLEDFKNLLNVAEQNGIKVIFDLVVNHTSDKHEWFTKSKQNPSGEYGDYYVWINNNDPRKNFKGSWSQNIWHSYSGKYYAGYFSNNMPDLNMINENVQNKIIEIADYWLDLGVDGFRIDAAMHMFGKNEYPENIDYKTENVLWWHKFRSTLQVEHPEVYLVGEVWDTSSVVAPYFKGLHSAFNFDVSSKILNSVKLNTSSGYTNTLNNIYNTYKKHNPNFMDAPFLANHDEDRVASVLTGENDLKIAAEMLMMLSGNPFVYYGEELGMKGVKGGTGVWDITRRLPFIWSKASDTRNTTWYTNNMNANVLSVEEQLLDENSLLNHYKKLIKLRNENIALVKGDFTPYTSSTPNLIAFVKSYSRSILNQNLLVLHNTTPNDLTLNLESDDFESIVYKSNNENSYNLLKANTTLVLLIKLDKLNKYK